MPFPTQANLAGLLPAAEKAAFGWPTWTSLDSQSSATATATKTGLAGYCHALTHITVSSSAAPSGAVTLTIKDGTTIIWQVELATGVLTFTENFETRPLHASVGADLVASIGSTGSTGTISMAGLSVKQA